MLKVYSILSAVLALHEQLSLANIFPYSDNYWRPIHHYHTLPSLGQDDWQILNQSVRISLFASSISVLLWSGYFFSHLTLCPKKKFNLGNKSVPIIFLQILSFVTKGYVVLVNLVIFQRGKVLFLAFNMHYYCFRSNVI